MEAQTQSKPKKFNGICLTGFWIGIASVFLYFIGIIPLIGIVISFVGLFNYNKEVNKGKWQGVVGLILNIVYLMMNFIKNHFV